MTEKIIRVQIIDNEGFSCGRYNIPENEYNAFVVYITKKFTKDLIFKVLGETLFGADNFRPWNI